MGVDFSTLAGFMATIDSTFLGVVVVLYLVLPGIVGVFGIIYHKELAKSEMLETLAIINFLMFGILFSFFVLLGVAIFDFTWPTMNNLRGGDDDVFLIQYLRDNIVFFVAIGVIIAEFLLHNFFYKGAKANSTVFQTESIPMMGGEATA
jgi:hypothetical protein